MKLGENDLPEEVRKYFSEKGKKGGLAKGDCKRRNQDDPDYYKKIRAKRKDKPK